MALPYQFIPLHPTLWGPCYKGWKGRVKGKNAVRKRKKQGLGGKQPVVGPGSPEYLRWGWRRLAPGGRPQPAHRSGARERVAAGPARPRTGGLGVPEVEGPEEAPE